MKRFLLVLAACIALIFFFVEAANATQLPVRSPALPATAASSPYVVLVWSELGMHCLDGKDYSVFAVLPPFNTIHAQLLKRGEPPQVIVTGVKLTYEAIPDTTGSINTYSAPNKTNFWDYVSPLFHVAPNANVGLFGTPVQSVAPHAMAYNVSLGYWEAVGIPTIPYDDAMKRNAYPMARIVARDSAGTLLAASTVVLAVSDEMNCAACHKSGADAYAKPAAGWVYNADPAKDVKFNILRKHDDRWAISASMANALTTKGYLYQASLYQTAKAGMPVLCDACHLSNALPNTGIAGVRPLTQDMHSLHGTQIYLKTGQTLDQATSPFNSCYLCHPGLLTKCERGAMNPTACMNCHGNLSAVGAGTRTGWMTLPQCQMCHNSGLRYPTAFVAVGAWRTTTDTRFATQPNVPVAGVSLYRFSRTGHGSLYCSTCHGSQHAEYPTAQPNDNVYSKNLQGHAGKITECFVCHTAVPVTPNGGPHGMHTLGQAWVSAHGDYVESKGAITCASVAGANYSGWYLALTSAARAFKTETGTVSFAAGHRVSCYDCHNGPGGGGA